jgi:hypothetical protein
MFFDVEREGLNFQRGCAFPRSKTLSLTFRGVTNVFGPAQLYGLSMDLTMSIIMIKYSKRLVGFFSNKLKEMKTHLAR